MHRQNSPGNQVDRPPDAPSGEFDHLLREIEKEAVPERLLELALRLQAALAARSSRHDGEDNPAQV